MTDAGCIAANVARLRLDRRLTQDQLAARAGISRAALGRIERGAVVPRARTLAVVAAALGAPVGELVTPVRALEGVRFRARTPVHAREQILAVVSKWLEAYAGLEAELGDRPPFGFGSAAACDGSPADVARAARRAVGLPAATPAPDLARLLEDHGVKLLLLPTTRDSFFGLSVGERGGGPAVVVNTWDRISVERWIFTAAHELGHLLLHPSEYARDEAGHRTGPEQEADAFASEFLMPDEAFAVEWDGTHGRPLLERVLKVKRIFRVSYQTVLHRLAASEREAPDVRRVFQRQHREQFGKTLRKTDEAEPLRKSEFAWSWRRSGEPAGLSRHDFVEDRLARLVRRAVEEQRVSLGRAAEILGLPRAEMRRQARAWAA